MSNAERMDEAHANLATPKEIVPGYTYSEVQRAFRFDANGVHVFRNT